MNVCVCVSIFWLCNNIIIRQYSHSGPGALRARKSPHRGARFDKWLGYLGNTFSLQTWDRVMRFSLIAVTHFQLSSTGSAENCDIVLCVFSEVVNWAKAIPVKRWLVFQSVVVYIFKMMSCYGTFPSPHVQARKTQGKDGSFRVSNFLARRGTVTSHSSSGNVEGLLSKLLCPNTLVLYR